MLRSKMLGAAAFAAFAISPIAAMAQDGIIVTGPRAEQLDESG